MCSLFIYLFIFDQPLVPNSGVGNVMSKPTSIEVVFYYFCLNADGFFEFVFESDICKQVSTRLF